MMLRKFLDPTNEFAFKQIFGTEKNEAHTNSKKNSNILLMILGNTNISDEQCRESIQCLHKKIDFKWEDFISQRLGSQDVYSIAVKAGRGQDIINFFRRED